MASKLMSIEQAAALIEDGVAIAPGGNTFNRSPSALVAELVRRRLRNLTVIKTAGAYDVDLLCAAGLVKRLVFAYIGFENLFGIAPWFRRAAESGAIELWEHT